MTAVLSQLTAAAARSRHLWLHRGQPAVTIDQEVARMRDGGGGGGGPGRDGGGRSDDIGPIGAIPIALPGAVLCERHLDLLQRSLH